MGEGPAFVDHHVHLLRVAGRERPRYDLSTPSSIAKFHEAVRARGSTPMDEPPGDPTVPDLASALESALRGAAALGLVQVTEAGMPDWRYWDALVELRDAGRLPIAVHVLVASGAADLRRMEVARRESDDRLRLLGVKLYADGWLGPRTCACSEAFADRDGDGILFLDADTLTRRVVPFTDAGFTVATHAIGDRAIDAALAAYDTAYAGATREASPRVEHAQLLRPDLIDRFAASGVVACIQPCFAASDAQSLEAAFGGAFPEAYRWDHLLAAGGRVLAGSDFPIETLDPRVGLDQLVAGPGPVDRDTALRLMTATEPVTVIER